jgi:hypothetical protein
MKKALVVSAAMILALTITVCAADKPSFNFDLSGYFKLDGSYDQNVTSHGNFSLWTKPAGEQNKDQFNMTANHSRFIMKANGEGYVDANVTGHLEFDFYGGVSGATVPENKPMLLLRQAFFTVQKGGLQLKAGQAWDMVSPLNTPMLNYGYLLASGNIGYRRPQVTLTYTGQTGQNTSVTFGGGIARPMSDSLALSLTLANDGVDDGTDAGIPSFQGILEVNHKPQSGAKIRAGVSGLWGHLKAEAADQSEYETYNSWAVVGHLQVDFTPRFGILGEAYTGSNLYTYYGGVANLNTIDGTDAQGGWLSVWGKPHSKVKLIAGGGLDRTDDQLLEDEKRTNNQTFYGTVEYQLVPQVTLGLELSHNETEYKNTGSSDNLRVQSAFMLNF